MSTPIISGAVFLGICIGFFLGLFVAAMLSADNNGRSQSDLELEEWLDIHVNKRHKR